MDDLELLRAFRATVPAARAETREAARTRVFGDGGRVQDEQARRRRLLVVGATAVIAVAGAGAAYGIAERFLIGDPAPRELKERVAESQSPPEVKGLLIPVVRRRYGSVDVDAERMRLAASLDGSSGLYYLWSAPKRDGGECLFLQPVGARTPDGRPQLVGSGCTTDHGAKIVFDMAGTRESFGVVSGTVATEVKRLEIHFRGGRELAVPLQGRFFVYELRLVRDQLSGVFTFPEFALVGYDAAGKEIARDAHKEALSPEARAFMGFLHSFDPSREKPLFESRTRSGKPIRLFLFERNGERCNIIAVEGTKSGGCGRVRARPEQVLVNFEQIGGILLLYGQVGAAVERVELQFADGRAERLPIRDGYTFHRFDPDVFVDGPRPVAVIGRDKDGDVVAEKRLDGRE